MMRRMKRIAVLLLLVAAACGKETPAVTATVDEREPIGVWYVGAPQLDVREQMNDTAPVIATYQNGEAVSVLAEKGDWAEIRTGDRSGWAKRADLTTAEGREKAEENPEVKFRVMPMPVSAPSAKGEIYIEADVNTDGDVTSMRLISNTTGSVALADQNMAALRNAKFHPIVQNNERKNFKYYHKVTY
jgi:uncharacterized protein YgiM (DUF1202 family)